MKIKQNYYCLTDNNNKPDFRYIFTDKVAAEKKKQQLKNSTTGETIFMSRQKRDFFVDGIKKNLIGRKKLVNIKKGCWVKLKTKKINILDTIEPEIYFEKKITTHYEFSIKPVPSVLNHKTTAVSFSEHYYQQKRMSLATSILKNKSDQQTYQKQQNLLKNKINNIVFLLISIFKNLNINLKNTKKQLFSFSNYPSFKMYLIAFNVILISIISFSLIFYFNKKSEEKIALAIAEKQHLLVEKKITTENNIAVLGAKKEIDNTDSLDNVDKIVFNTLKEFEKIRSEELEKKILTMVAGTPMEKMAPYIAKKDKVVAAFLVGIAKKESNYGRRVPVLNGKDCFNYWGYRGIRKKMGTGGHTCFDSPEDAVNTVGGRIERLVKSGVNTPQEMVLWKCGSACHKDAMAGKWIKDVNMYFSKMLQTQTKNNQI